LSGSKASENIVVAANGDHAAISVDVGNVALNPLNVERIEIGAAGGADHITIGDLTGTGVQQVAVNLASSPTGTSGDGKADTVDVSATGGDDHISIANNGKTIVVTGLAEQVTVDGAEAKNDSLTVHGLGGNDTIDASHLATGHINLTIDGGVGNDTITGSAGNDVVIGGIGNDILRGGAGNDTFVWNVGDGNDSIDGQTGTDQLVFNGSSASEHIAFSSNGTSGILSSDVGGGSVSMHGVETVNFQAQNGSDTITINDMTGSGVQQINLDLSSRPAGTDSQHDTIVINGTSGADNISLSLVGDTLTIEGLASKIVIQHYNQNDVLEIHGLGGDDVITAVNLSNSGPKLLIDGGDGNDVLIGSAGNETILGGAGDDTLFGVGGQDVLDGGTGNNTFIDVIASLTASHGVLLH